MATAGQIRRIVAKLDVSDFPMQFEQLTALLAGKADSYELSSEEEGRVGVILRQIKELVLAGRKPAEKINVVRVAAGGSPKPIPEPPMFDASASAGPVDPEPETEGPQGSTPEIRRQKAALLAKLRELEPRVEAAVIKEGGYLKERLETVRDGIESLMTQAFSNDEEALGNWSRHLAGVETMLAAYEKKLTLYGAMEKLDAEAKETVTVKGEYLKTEAARLLSNALLYLKGNYSEADDKRNRATALTESRALIADIKTYEKKLALSVAAKERFDEITPQLTEEGGYIKSFLEKIKASAEDLLSKKYTNDQESIDTETANLEVASAMLAVYKKKLTARTAFGVEEAKVSNLPSYGGNYIRETATSGRDLFDKLIKTEYTDEEGQIANCVAKTDQLKQHLAAWPAKAALKERFDTVSAGIGDLTSSTAPRVFSRIPTVREVVTQLVTTHYSDEPNAARAAEEHIDTLEKLIAEEKEAYATVAELSSMAATTLERKSTAEQVAYLNKLRGHKGSDGTLSPEQREAQRKVYKAIAKSGTHGLEPKFEEHEEPIRLEVRERVKTDIMADADTKAAIKDWNTYGEGMSESERRTKMGAVTDWSKWEEDPALDADVKADLQKKLAVANRILASQCAIRGIDPPPEIVFKAPTPPSTESATRGITSKGQFSASSGKIELNPDPRGAFADFADLVDTVIHENTHNYQHILVKDLEEGRLAESDDRYLQAQVFAANFASGGYVDTDEDHEDYKIQPVERHAWQAGGEAKILGRELARTISSEGST